MVTVNIELWGGPCDGTGYKAAEVLSQSDGTPELHIAVPLTPKQGGGQWHYNRAEFNQQTGTWRYVDAGHGA